MATKKSTKKSKAQASATISPTTRLSSELVSMNFRVPVSAISARVSVLAQLGVSASVVIRGNRRRVSSVIATLGRRMDVVSARVTLRNISAPVSLRGR